MMTMLIKKRHEPSCCYKRYLLTTSLTAAMWTLGESFMLISPSSTSSSSRRTTAAWLTSSSSVSAVTTNFRFFSSAEAFTKGGTIMNDGRIVYKVNRSNNNDKDSLVLFGKMPNVDGDDERKQKTATKVAVAPGFKRGDKILVEIVGFGPLGASVNVVGRGFDEEATTADESIIGQGLVLQKEIHYYRLARGGIDVVRGEILPAYVEHIRDDLNGKLDISLRPAGGMAKSLDLSSKILDLLLATQNGVLNVGDKSTPEEINAFLPGTSKLAFKKAVSALYKQKKIILNPTSIRLVL